MVINDFDVVCVPVGEYKTDSPTPVRRHSPLARAITLQLVQSHALQRTEILQRFGDIQRQQKICREIEIEAANERSRR
jgi:hypothetical protein